MNHKIWQRLFAIVMLGGMLLAPFQAGSVSAGPLLQDEATPKVDLTKPLSRAPDAKPVEKPPAISPQKEIQKPADTTGADLLKIHPDLREAAKAAAPALPSGYSEAAGAQEALLIEVVAEALDAKDGRVVSNDVLSKYFVDGKVYARPALSKGEVKLQLFIGRAYPWALLKIAALAEVRSIIPMVFEQNAYPEDYPADEPRQIPVKGPEDWEALRLNAEKMREGSLPWSEAKAFGDGREAPVTEDWFEVSVDGPHKAAAAWARGFEGQGVTVAVLDDGIDAAHPDLMGTQQIYSSTSRTEYNGWPMVYSPFSALVYWNDEYYGTSLVPAGYPSIHYVDTSTVPATYSCQTGVKCFSYTPLIDTGVPGYTHTYVFSSSWTKSGVVHVGTHPDVDLRDFVWGEKPAVLVVDSNVAGVYDTVYVDLDSDYDFRDEKPLTKADTSSAAQLALTKNDMISYRDMNGDGLADISGGMLYFIGDGQSVIPGTDYEWGADCTGGGFMCPGNGDLVAFSGSTFDRAYSHGTQCASNVVGQGVVQNASMGLDNSFLPSFRDLPPGPGKPAAAVYGMAPKAGIVNVSDIYWNHEGSTIDAYLFAAVGYDAVDQTGFNLVTGDPFDEDTDTIIANSNSYGASDEDNDGWDYRGQIVSFLQKWYAPYGQYLFSTGNGAPGFGTAAPPSPATGIGVGASTEYGSTGWDTITDTNQIMNNDVVAFSNSGPGAREGTGVEVLAGGAFAAGDEELNYYSISTWGAYDGNMSWVSWGGTSRSAPVALGVLALIYQAYKDAHGTWPTHEQAKALLMSTATDLDSNVFRQGAGSVNADRGTAAASGEAGVYMDGGDAAWVPGDYRGLDAPSFAHIVYPGDTWDKEFNVVNDSAVAVDVEISDAVLTLIGSEQLELTVTPDMVAGENADNFYKAFQYMIPLTATASADASMHNIVIPPGTDLMVVRQAFPFDEFDVDGNFAYDNRFYLMVYNWKDVDGDGIVWDDKDGNGVVNFVNDSAVTLIDYGTELVWDDPITELDRYEYGRFGYNRPTANTNELMVHDPLGRMHDGLFIGLRHLKTAGGAAVGAHLSYNIEFYSKSDAAWLSTDVTTMTVPAGGSASFMGQVNVPADIPSGDYEAAIEVYDTAGAFNTVIPVVIHVAQDFTGANTFGGYDAYLDNFGSPYNNGAVRGYQEWGWRAESGDWRMFYMDIDNAPFEVEIMTQDFEGAWPPTGWSVVTNVGEGWNTNTYWGRANITPGANGVAAGADADAYGSGVDSELWSPAIDLTGAATPVVVFDSNFQDFAGSGDAYLDVSTNSGSSWTNLWTTSVDEPAGGTTHTIDLSAYAGQTIWLRWHFVTPGWDWYWYIDDVRVVDVSYPFPPDSHVIVKDEWEAPSPHNDIDTVVLGPSPISICWYCGYDFNLVGPYTLDVVGKSANTNLSAGIWAFETSSGGNEEWVTFPIQDGLHRILEHNVMFEGDQFDVVFTKTVGLLMEDVHDMYLETYLSEGELGSVTLESTLDLPNLHAEGYVNVAETTEFIDEPITFGDENDIEWVYPFSVTDGVYIEAYTSSGDISDIDLYLFYWNGSSYEQRASSAGSSASEYVYVANPEDGDWLIGINNWSGPAGHFDMVVNVGSRGPEFTFTGTTDSEVPAGTPVTLTASFSGLDEPGEYYGVINAGPSVAPALKQIPVLIVRLPDSAMVRKSADVATVFPGDEVNYDVDLFNLSDPDAEFHFSDPLPEGTEYVAHTNPLINNLIWEEGFEGSFPPTGWSVIENIGSCEWESTATTGYGNFTDGSGYAADANSDWCGPGTQMDTELWTPAFDMSSMVAPFLTFQTDFNDLGAIDDGYVDVSTDSGATWTNEVHYDGADFHGLQTVDLSAYAGEASVMVRFHYTAPGWDWWWQVDDVKLYDLIELPFVFDAPSNSLLYTGTLPMGSTSTPAAVEGFEDGVLPEGWMVEHNGFGGEQWMIYDVLPHTGAYHMGLWWDVSDWDEWLYSPEFTVNTSAPYTMTFWALSSTNPDWDYYTMQLVALDAEGNELGVLWDMTAQEDWPDPGATPAPWREVSVDMSAYAGENVRLAWHGIGNAYYVFFVDDVSLPGTPVTLYHPSATVGLTVSISDTVSSGDFITNTAGLGATHFMPQGEEEEPAAEGSAVVHVGLEEFMTSYKWATEEVAPGEMIEYQVHVINSGDALAYVTVTDTIPAHTTFYGLDNSPPYQYFEYDAGEDAVKWQGNIAPFEEKVFTFWVMADYGLALGDVIENTAVFSWNGVSMELEASTEIIFKDLIYLPIISK